MKKIKNPKSFSIKRMIFPCLIIIATLCISVGYAAVNSVILDIGGIASVEQQSGIIITEIKYLENDSADIKNSTINNIYQTMLDSNIVLSNENSSSSITYSVTIYNSTDNNYYFDKIDYILGDGYSNENISVKLNGLYSGYELNSKDSVTFELIFYYEKFVSDKNILKSTINFNFLLSSYVAGTYDYKGSYEIFSVPHTGLYKIELWGAQGGGTGEFAGGMGAYTAGYIDLEERSNLNVYVGESGGNQVADGLIFNNGGFNFCSNNGCFYTGGGSTDIRLTSGYYNDFNSIKSRIMVAAGGGGGQQYFYHDIGGAGGGLVGYDGAKTNLGTDGLVATGGTQTSGGTNGLGSYGNNGYQTNFFGYVYVDDNAISTGGGNGYYAGGNGAHGDITTGAGAGGSSFISGHNGCDAISADSIESNIIHTGQSVHYSGYKFSNTTMIDGNGYNWTNVKKSIVGLPTPNGNSMVNGHSGNGYAKITYIGENVIFSEDFDVNKNYFLNNATAVSQTNGYLTLKSLTSDPQLSMNYVTSFNPLEYRYLEVRYRTEVKPTTSTIQFYMIENPGTETYGITQSSITDGEWHIAIFDLWSVDAIKNREEITGWRLDFASISDITVDLDYVRVRK